MSGDVQPRKRKDKKRKKDELGVEEPRGTAAVFGEGDVFMHSQHDHSTGGHWCAKIIFFSLLTVLITLVGLIILENRGLTELEANSVETRYSGVLEGWIEDAPDDDHHDEHTLELKHHEEDEGGHDEDSQSNEIEQDDDDNVHDDNDDEHADGDDEDDHDENIDNDDDDEREQEEDEVEQDDDEDDEDEDEIDNVNHIDDERDEDSQEQNLETPEHDEEEDEGRHYSKYYDSVEDQGGDDDDDEDDEDNLQTAEHDDQSVEEDEDNATNDHSIETNDDVDVYDNDDDEDESNNDSDVEGETRYNEDEEENDSAEEDTEVEVEKIEREISDEDAVSIELPVIESKVDEDQSQEVSKKEAPEEDGDDDVEFLEPDDFDNAPVVEHITASPGKPLAEVEETSSEKPLDTLAEEEEYEKQQEALRREKEQASHSMWLKLAVGGALLAATHALVRRATASGDTNESELDTATQESPTVTDRRMTLLPEAVKSSPAVSNIVPERERPPIPVKEFARQTPLIIKSSPITKQVNEDEEEEEKFRSQAIKDIETKNSFKDKELYSDDEDVEDEEEIEEKEEGPKQSAPVKKEDTPEPEEEIPDDVEIIDDEQLEEEFEEEDVEEEISDVDDAELLSRLEAKYGRLPEPERPGQKHKEGGNSIEDEWPGEPSDTYWRQQLDHAERELREGEWSTAAERAGAARLHSSARARWVAARALDAAAAAARDNRLLSRAITAYLDLLKMNERLSDRRLLLITDRTLDRIKFRGNYLNAEPVYRLLIRRFPDDPAHRNNLSISFLMANRPDLAEDVLKETLQRWPDDRVALAHHGFVLKTQHNRLEEAVEAFQSALAGDSGPANEPRFYYHLGDALLLLGRFTEAHEVHKRGAALGHFLSPAQRSLYNVERLRSRPWWKVEETPYAKLARALEKTWKEILEEGEAARTLYEKEKEGLRERGEWSQLDLFVRGREIPDRCKRAPVTCGVVRAEAAAGGCRRGQVKFSAMEAGTHVRPHVGPTNCRLRMHLGLSNTKDTYIRVDQETRQWQSGKVLIFDDSFEHEVWHNGTGTRLVLIVDVWHPDLTPAERRQLPAI